MTGCIKFAIIASASATAAAQMRAIKKAINYVYITPLVNNIFIIIIVEVPTRYVPAYLILV